MIDDKFKMSYTEAEQHVACLKVGDLMYKPSGYKVVIIEIETNIVGDVKFWYKSEDKHRYLRIWINKADLIARFMKFGPIDNDPIIVHKKLQIPNVVYTPAESLSHCTTEGTEYIETIKATMSSEALRGYLRGSVMNHLLSYEDKTNPVEDLKEACWYLNQLIKEVSSDVQ